MSRIDRYILRQLVLSMVLVTAGLTGILWLTQSLRFIEMTVQKGASIGDFLLLTMLLMPNFLTVILPVSLFAVVLFGYNKLIADRELVAMRAIGLSHWTLARPAVILAFVATLIGYVLNLWVIPDSVAEFHRLQWAIRSNATGVLLREGTFNDLGNGLTVFVRSRGPGGELLGLVIHDHRNVQRPVTILAERGALIRNPNGPPTVLLINGSRQIEAPGDDRLSLLYFDRYAMQLSDSPESSGDIGRDARERSLHDLLAATVANVGPVRYRQYREEAHQRLSSPLYHLSFALLAAACLLVGHFNRRGQADRIVLAVAAMVAIQAMALGISDVATRNLALVPLLYVCPIATALAALGVLVRPTLSLRGSTATTS